MHPRLIEIGNFSLPTYGFLVAAGMILGLLIVFHLSKKSGLDPDEMWNLGGLVVFAGIIGSKILMILVDWGYYSHHVSEIFSIGTLRAGGVFSGGLVLAIITAFWYLHKIKVPFPRAADVFAPGLALGHALGRIGCFSAGCCFGRETSVPWAVTFHDPEAAAVSGTPLGVHLHPTQLYEMAAEFINFAILYWLIGRKKFEGQVIGLYMFLYGVERYVIEFFRGDPGRGEVFGIMSGTQLISIGLVIGGGILWMIRMPLRRQQAVTARSA